MNGRWVEDREAIARALYDARDNLTPVNRYYMDSWSKCLEAAERLLRMFDTEGC